MNPTISVETLVEEVSKAAFAGNAAAFVGAGISTPSNLPNWPDLVRPLAEPLGLIIKEDDDLPGIAQYIVNMSAGSRTSLFARIQNSIKTSKAKPNHYHYSLAKSTIDVVWTTNYDNLLESAYSTDVPIVRSRDTDLAHHPNNGRREIIKAHGCIDRSSADELVITREDFEDYFVRHPLIAERLRSDLQRKTFLFAGYGYGDPNIANILVEARRLAHKTPRQRYMLQKVSDPKKSLDAVHRQQQWIMDLRRVGIDCALVPDFAGYATAMADIALMSRGPTLYVTGSHKVGNELAAAVGVSLADNKEVSVVILDGQSTGASRSLIQAFVDHAARNRVDFRDRLRFFPNPYAQVPKLSDDSSLLGQLKEWRASMLRTAHTVLAFDGGMGTTAEVELAAELGCNLVLVSQSANGSSAKLKMQLGIGENEKAGTNYVCVSESDVSSAGRIVDLITMSMPRWTTW